MHHLVHAIDLISRSQIGRFAIVGGVAVAVRLGQAHRATQDVDAVVDDQQRPTALKVLSDLPEAKMKADGQLMIAEVKVDPIEVGAVPTEQQLAGFSERQALFVLGHGWALETATPVPISALGGMSAVVSAPFATVSALLAMKLHAIQDRPGARQDKRAGDAWDIHQLLTHHNARGDVARSIELAPAPLRAAVHLAAQRILIDQAERTRSWMRGLEGAGGSVGADELRALGEALVGSTG